MTHDDFREMISFYIDDSLSETEKEAFEVHVRECSECREELDVMKQILLGLNEMEELELPSGFGKELEGKLLAVNTELAEVLPISLEEKRKEKKLESEKKNENLKKKPNFQWRYAYNTAAALILVVAVTAFFNSGIHFMDKASQYAAPKISTTTEKNKNNITPSVSPEASPVTAMAKEATGGAKVGNVSPTTSTYDLSASNSGKFDPATNVVNGDKNGTGNGENRNRSISPNLNTSTPTPTLPPQNEMFAMMKAAPRELLTGTVLVTGNKDAYLTLVKDEVSASGGALLSTEKIDGKIHYTFEMPIENFWPVYEKITDQEKLKEQPELKDIELKKSEEHLDKTEEYEGLSKTALEKTDAGASAAKALKDLENALLKAKIVIIVQE